jgi:hypothetical protein
VRVYSRYRGDKVAWRIYQLISMPRLICALLIRGPDRLVTKLQTYFWGLVTTEARPVCWRLAAVFHMGPHIRRSPTVIATCLWCPTAFLAIESELEGAQIYLSIIFYLLST